MKLDLEILQFCCCLIANLGTDCAQCINILCPPLRRAAAAISCALSTSSPEIMPSSSMSSRLASRSRTLSSKYRVTMLVNADLGWVDLDFGSSGRYVDSCYSYLLPKGKSTQPWCAATMVTPH